MYREFIKKEYERLFGLKPDIKKRGIKTRELCQKCGKWDRTIKWCKGLNPPKCRCGKPNTIVKNYPPRSRPALGTNQARVFSA